MLCVWCKTIAKVLQESCFVKNNSCYEFLLCSVDEGKRMMIKQKKRPLNLQIENFRYIFDAINALFPPIFSQDFSYFATYKRYFNIYIFENHKVKNNSIEAFYIKETNSSLFTTNSGNIFECSGKVFIFHVLLCDGKQDCPHGASDEIGCKCSSSEFYHSKM